MRPFRYTRAENLENALVTLKSSSGSRLLGGGTNLIDLMRLGIEQPDHLVDVQRLPMNSIEELPNGGVRIGAGVKNTDIANHPIIRKQFPLLSKALLSGASPQIRNMATTGGNLMQRTRCYYFMDPAFPACNKRVPGSGCAALDGINRIHAIFGASESCIAAHPSDMCVALSALDAVIQVRGPRGQRSIAIGSFHRLPGDTPHIDTNLAHDEIIISVDLPPSRWGARWEYVKVRDRQSFAFALVSCAAALDLKGTRIRDVRLVFGGIAHKPWRAFDAERFLTGKDAGPEVFSQSARLAVKGAGPRPGNQFKVLLMEAVTKRALIAAGEMA